MTLRADPDCPYCGGDGMRFWHVVWHAGDCVDDHCALAGGVHDCAGDLDQCPCVKFLLIYDGDDYSVLLELDAEPPDDSLERLAGGRLVARGSRGAVRAAARLRCGGAQVAVLGEDWPRGGA